MKTLLSRLLLVACLAATTAPASENDLDTGKVVSPESIEGSIRVDAEGVLELINKFPQLVMIDARIPGDRKFGYIESSISLPNTETRCETLAGVIPATDNPVVFYCNGSKCGRSAKNTRIAVQCGYRQIYWFRGGIEEWSAMQFPLLR